MKKIIICLTVICLLVSNHLAFAEVIKDTSQATKKGLKGLFFSLPNKVGGAVSVGFDTVGRFMDNLGEKEKVSKSEKKSDPLPITEYYQQRKF